MIHDLSWLLVEAGTSLFEIILIVTFLSGFLVEKEISKIKKVTVLWCSFVVLFLVSTFLYNIPNILTINFLVLSLSISFFLYKGKFSQFIFSCALLLAILAVVEIISMSIVALAMKVEAIKIQSDPLLKFLCVVLKNILSYAVIKIISNFRKSNIHDVNKLYLAFLFIVPIICTIITLLIVNMVIAYDVKNMTPVLVSSVGIMYINFIVFGMFEALMRQMDKDYKYKMIEKQLELQLTHYNKLAENRAKLSEVVHDFKNHLNCIYNLYKYNNNHELGRYIENLINITDVEKVIDTGNPVIDALLNDKYNAAKKVGIQFRRDLNFPSNLKIEPTDICAVLGNSLDNAIEACKRISSSALQREITLSMTYRDSYLVIVVSNSTDQLPQKEGRFFRSSKPSPELHGLGMHSIERTVRKYDGNMVVKCDPGIFKLEIVMLTA